MKDLQPATFIWMDAMVPTPESLPLCMRQFVHGEVYRLSAEEERSVASHRQFMAVVNEAFINLPEHLASHFRNVDHLRYWCLVKCGFATDKTIVYQTVDDAERTARWMMEEDDHIYASASGNVLTVWKAKSQKYANMNKEEFQAAKQAVFDLLSDMIGTSVTELKKNAGRAA